MTGKTEIEQVILYKEGNIKNKFDIKKLQIKNENYTRKKIYVSMCEEDRLYKNTKELNKDAISKYYEYVKKYHEIAGITFDENQQRTKKEWKLYEGKRFKNCENKEIKISNFARVKIDGKIIPQKEKDATK